MPKTLVLLTATTCACLFFPTAVPAQYVMENLGRGLIAIRASENTVYVGWRLLGTDPSDLAFNVYRASGAGAPARLNDVPLVATTNVVDVSADLSLVNTYTVRPVLKGVELAASSPFVLSANAPVQQYLTVPLERPAGGNVEVPVGSPSSAYTYSPNDASVGDLDGDGEYEIIVKWDPSNSRDNAAAGLSGRQLIDAYKIDGTRLWRIDLGRNSRAGAHYTQFLVYRLGIAWQNVAYNQPPHPGFFLGEGMAEPPKPHIVHRDTTGPAFRILNPSTTLIWPPNHKMVPVSLSVDLVDLIDPAPTARIVGVSSNEPVDGDDDGHTTPDWEVTGPLTVALRAERSGTGTGRIYTIEVEGRDTAGNVTVRTISVSVPLRRP